MTLKTNKITTHAFKSPALTISWVVVILAVTISTAQFLYNRSLWLDEARLALNIINKSHFELLLPLDMNQVAPILYLQIVKLFSAFTPEAEYGLRLFPLLCFWAALVLFYKTARLLFKDTLPLIFVVSLFALNYSMVYYSSEVKQYMTDVFVAVLFIFLLLRDYKSPGTKHLSILVAGIVALWVSNVAPIILFASGVGLLQQSLSKQKKGLWPLVGVGGVWLIVFVVYYVLFLYDHPTRAFMQAYWSEAHAFLPLNPFSSDFWVFLLYRLGGLSKMSFSPFVAIAAAFSLFVLAGYVHLLKNKKTFTFILLALPIVTHMLLSAIALYPFIGRLILYLAPYVILASGFGLQTIVDRWPVKEKAHRAAFVLVPGLFLALLMCSFPLHRSEIKQPLEFIQDNRQQGDSLYVAPGSVPAYTYYMQTGHFCENNMVVILGGPRMASKEAFFEQTILSLTGSCWLLFSHNLEKADYVVEKLGKMNLKPAKAFETVNAVAYLFNFNSE